MASTSGDGRHVPRAADGRDRDQYWLERRVRQVLAALPRRVHPRVRLRDDGRVLPPARHRGRRLAHPGHVGTAFPLRRRYPELKALIPLTLFTLLLQSGMGAWAVKYPQTPPVMASHFGISLVCFASVFLVMRVLWEPRRSLRLPRARCRRIPNLAWVTLLWAVVVAYIGAYVRHSGAELACYTWPLCNGSLIPDLSSPGVAVAWVHRLAA